MLFPIMSSVSREALATAALHPRVRNRAAAIRPLSMRTARCNSSPQTGLLTSTVLVASGRSPTLRGCSQCSSTTALYILRVSQSELAGATRTACVKRSLNAWAKVRRELDASCRPANEQHHDQNKEKQPESPTRKISPVRAIGPGGQSSENGQQQHD